MTYFSITAITSPLVLHNSCISLPWNVNYTMCAWTLPAPPPPCKSLGEIHDRATSTYNIKFSVGPCPYNPHRCANHVHMPTLSIEHPPKNTTHYSYMDYL